MDWITPLFAGQLKIRAQTGFLYRSWSATVRTALEIVLNPYNRIGLKARQFIFTPASLNGESKRMNENQQQEMADFKQYVAGVFSRAAADYDQVGPQFFTYFGRKLVDFARLSDADSILDVACGRGAVLFPAAAAAHQVTGIDIAAGMVEETAREIKRRGITNARVQVMDAEDLQFDAGSFDTVLCGVALFFLPDLDRALGEIRRVLKPGGYLVASTFLEVQGGLEDRWGEVNASFKDHLRPGPGGGDSTQELSSEKAIKETLSGAGFESEKIITEQGTFEFVDEDTWWRWLWSVGNRSFLERLDPAYEAAYRKELGRFFFEEGEGRSLPVTWDVLMFCGRKPLLADQSLL
jgi:ubiquinone/menaquinone biosynthesis C-methylase UbiE